MPGSGLHRRTDKTNCQPATRGVQGKALFKGVQGEVQDGALNGNQQWRGTRRRKENSGCALTEYPYSIGSGRNFRKLKKS